MLAEYICIVPLLAIMEISLSFDNAVVNAIALKNMSQTMQKLFVTYGMFFSVFLVRLLLPAVIVSISSHVGLIETMGLSWNNPDAYAQRVVAAHTDIASFGGTFLLLIFYGFLFNVREEHWLSWIEKPCGWCLRDANNIERFFLSIYAAFFTSYAFGEEALPVAIAIGIYSIMAFIKSLLHSETASAIHIGILSFLYLELLDASFSLDGVIGAFSMTSNIIVIMLGLGIGSFAIRNLTIYMVRHKMLEAFKYLEHGANWAIGVLGLLMLLSLKVSIPEVITGLAGITFIIFAIISSEVESRHAHT